MKAPLVGEFLGLPLNQTPNLYLLDVLEKLKQTNKKTPMCKPQATFPSTTSHNTNNSQEKNHFRFIQNHSTGCHSCRTNFLTQKAEIYLDL